MSMAATDQFLPAAQRGDQHRRPPFRVSFFSLSTTGSLANSTSVRSRPFCRTNCGAPPRRCLHCTRGGRSCGCRSPQTACAHPQRMLQPPVTSSFHQSRLLNDKGSDVNTHVIDVNMSSRASEEGVHSPSQSNGLVIIIIRIPTIFPTIYYYPSNRLSTGARPKRRLIIRRLMSV
jgi:hypothetical protein